MLQSLFDDVTRLIHEGQYETAFRTAKRLSIDLLKQQKRGDAALALASAGHVLCLLNSPSKAKSFAQEAHDMAARDKNGLATGYALAVKALAQLRQAGFEQAEKLLEASLDVLNATPDHQITAFAQLVSAELSIAQEDFAEARVFAEDAFATGASLNLSWIKARACLVKGICEHRTGNLEPALELLQAAEKELKSQPDVETLWLVKSAAAAAYAQTGNQEAGDDARKTAIDVIDSIADRLQPEAKDRYLKNPAIVNAMGDDGSRSGVWKMPMQIPTPRPKAQTRPFGNLRPVLDVIKKINTELNLRKLITMILDTMIEFCNAQRGTIVLFEGDKYKVNLSRNRERKELKRFEMGVSRTILKLVRDHGKRVVAEDAQQDPSLKLVDSVQDQSLLSILCVPLRVKMRLIGAVYLDNPEVVGAFGANEIEIAEILTDHAAVAIDNTLLHIKSTHDNLTNLFNHAHFEKRLDNELARARRHGRSCGLIMTDIDDFKKINDTLGHDAGNEILKTVARLLATTVRGADLVARIQERDATPIVARYGGDEFEIILPEADRDGVKRVGERILSALKEETFTYGDQVLKLTFSVGGAVFPENASNARELLLKADEALYDAKRAGKNRVALYSPKPPTRPKTESPKKA